MADSPAVRRAFSVAVYPRHLGRCLVIHHRRLGVWLPPGGECLPDEAPLAAAARELAEETGLHGRFPTLSPIDGAPAGLIGYEEHPAGSKGEHLNFVFVADVDSDEVRPNHEFGEWRWVEKMDGLVAPPNVGQLLAVALAAGAPPGELSAAGPPSVAVARRWLEAFNRQDLDALLRLYAADAVHESPKLRARAPETLGRVVGHAALRAWWADAFARLPSLRYQALTLTGDATRAWMEYLRVVDGEPGLPVAEVLELGDDGRIVASRVFHG